jgi:AraC-like DNA-binding protein
MHETEPQAAPAPKLQHSVLDTEGLSANEAVSVWQESISVMFDARLRQTSERPFHARVEAFLIGNLVLGECRAGAQTFDRSRRRIGRDDLDHVMLQFYDEGICGKRDGGSGDQTRPGDLWFSDLAQPQATAASDFKSINLIMPRRLFAPLLQTPDEHHLRRIPGSSPLVGLLHNHLQALFKSASQMTPQEAEAIVRPTLELAAAAVNGTAAEANAAGVGSSLLGAIARHVEARLPDPGLSAESVAAAFGISERKLYYLFEPRGGFASYVQDQRLYRCHQALADPAQRHRSIAEIAEAYGFTHPKSFSRAFRRKIGMTAREVRGLAADRDSQSMLRPNANEWWSWIERMR